MSKYCLAENGLVLAENNDALAKTLWTPELISTQAWYDASDSSTITLGAGSNVSQWDDKSSTSRNVSQGNSSNQPTISNSVISFNGTTDYLFNNSPFMYDNGEIDIYIVGSVNSGTDDRLIAEGSTVSNQPIYSIETYDSDASRMCAFQREDNGTENFNHTVLSPVGAFDNTTKLYSWRDTGSQWSGRVNAGTATTAGYARGGATTLNTFCIGGLLRASFAVACAMDISEIVVTDNLTDTNRQLVEGYLAWKWGLEGNLPAGHPYKTERPYV